MVGEFFIIENRWGFDFLMCTFVEDITRERLCVIGDRECMLACKKVVDIFDYVSYESERFPFFSKKSYSSGKI